MKILWLIRGPSGSGKSILANMLLYEQGGVEYSADDYFYENGEYVFRGELLPEAHKTCQEQTQEAMAQGVANIYVHNTFTRRWELAEYYLMAKRYGYEVQEIILKKPIFKNVHGVPQELVESQARRMEY